MSVKVLAKVTGFDEEVEIASAEATLNHNEAFEAESGLSKSSNSQRVNKLRSFARNVLMSGQGVVAPDREGVVGSEYHETPEKGAEGHTVHKFTTGDFSTFVVSFTHDDAEVFVPASAVESIRLVDAA